MIKKISFKEFIRNLEVSEKQIAEQIGVPVEDIENLGNIIIPITNELEKHLKEDLLVEI